MHEPPVILIVDDLPSSILMLGNVLSDAYEVRFATNGQEALTLALEAPPDLVLLDVNLPDRSGYDVCRTLKADPAFTFVPILFLTAMDKDEDESLGLEAGALDFLTKPVKPALVLARIRNHLQTKRLVEEQTRLVADLQNSIRHIEELQGMLPICSWCKKIRNDQGYWEQIEGYISRYSRTTWTHGICPECRGKHFCTAPPGDASE